ncbi:MAG: Tat pathway signal protein [Candidatus Acidiferrales bacterium]
MKRRNFIQSLATTAVGTSLLQAAHAASLNPQASAATATSSTEGHTLVSEFNFRGAQWEVYEDLRTRDGAITFVSARGDKRVMAKSAEAQFPDADPQHLGLSMDDVGLSGPDLLADKLLAHGDDPDPEMVKKAAPPQGQPPRSRAGQQGPPPRPRWTAIVGTKEAFDTQPVFPLGSTRTYHPEQFFPELRDRDTVSKRSDGLLGGWMPAVRKAVPVSETSHIEVIVFGDVEADDQFIVQTWHRTAQIENGKITKVVYGYTYPAFPPARQDPKPEEFYRALLAFAEYWDQQLRDFAPTSLPDESWVAMSKHCFAKELMCRPNGVYPKYGAVDRDYYGSEYDGFQDIFTMATYTNLEWGRFDLAKAIIDNYFTDFVDARGMCNMRGPEVAQFGMTLSLLARYFHYTRDAALIAKHRPKIAATAKVLTDMHDECLKRPSGDLALGLIHGWSESDACLHPNPSVWWLPYYANNAFSARGLQDIGRAWPEIFVSTGGAEREAQSWLERSKVLRDSMVAAMEKDIWKNETPPYIGPFPGTKMKFRESLEKERPSPQLWAHRPYAELLQADMLPEHLANTVIDCMRANGATTIGVVANVGRPRAGSRAILGFISYGYAQMLLRLDRIEEYLLFLHSHRYHDHTRGTWTAGEVSGITGGTALFCVPAQQTIPLLVRWMLVLEDSDEERLYFARGVPRDWVTSGKPIRIEQAPTRWGRVTLDLVSRPGTKSVVATVDLARGGAPREIHVKLRVPKQTPLHSVTVNGRAAQLSGKHNDTVVIATGSEKQFEVVGQIG